MAKREESDGGAGRDLHRRSDVAQMPQPRQMQLRDAQQADGRTGQKPQRDDDAAVAGAAFPPPPAPGGGEGPPPPPVPPPPGKDRGEHPTPPHSPGPRTAPP